ncbi:DNA (cytosine-5-)-methyltransferase [Candidatus Woesearchaeota archaeon]|nr:DNA (cytosine-5-)-methyltransferase [Candidatus Woesearchaeota archaeon]MCF7901759.1 DNA (cytosine-5-)-methyltransferase [Candidatus Woesearchaeota archaeon]MCF8013172.1 DNA (cytosine-5-)-methyltransferase [Candidatus Woesearchaeota archaeon]
MGLKKIRVIDLFAGVGGFRIGLDRASKRFETVWSNQWEPGTKTQDASNIYVKRFGEKNHSNVDIAKVDISEIPDFDMIVGGFPCQDYSVAKTLSQSQGIVGKKGVLWWEIHRLISSKKKYPDFVFLENVDRLLKSPASQRGRDFAIILASLSDLGYAVEWRAINAADYGFPQRRRRVFILAYNKRTTIYKELKKTDSKEWVIDKGVFAQEFNIDKHKILEENKFEIQGNLVEITDKFNKGKKNSPFSNLGVMIDRKVYSAKITANYHGKRTTLGDILIPEKDVPEEFFINGDYKKWEYLKGAKSEERTNKKENFTYKYAEGSMVFPDTLDKPSRTIVTGEGGSSASRFKHVVKCKSGRLRRLTPLELERLNMFPDNHTEGASNIKRAFFMGNALVIGVIEKIGKALIKKLDSTE